jgi:DNA-binding response OmpR family regulator
MSKLLIVDDEEIARLTLAEILRLEGFSIKAVESGEAAVKALAEEPFDAMILDLKMPGMGGMEVLRTVVDSLPELSVIVLTAHGTMDTAIQAIRYRVHDYLLKPVAPEQVVASVEEALIKKRLGHSPGHEDRPAGRARTEHLPGGALLTWDKREITWPDGELSLTPTEARLLKTLFERKNEMVPHAELVYLIQGYKIDTEEAAKILRPVVSRLRQKLLVVPGWGDRIKNVRGAGYVLEI